MPLKFSTSLRNARADLNLNTTSIVAGGPVQVTSATIAEGGA